MNGHWPPDRKFV
jgi:serine/threonine protein kinase